MIADAGAAAPRQRFAVPGEIRRNLGSGVAVAVSMLVMFLSGFVMQFALKGFGVAIRLEQMPVAGVTGALLPIASQNFGALSRVHEALFL